MKKFLIETDGKDGDCKICYFSEANSNKTRIEVKGTGKDIITGLGASIINIALDVAEGDEEVAFETVDLFCEAAKDFIREEIK